MNPKRKYSKAKKKLKKGVNSARKKMTGPVKSRFEKQLGIFIFKYHATLFFWDDRIQAMVFGGEHKGVEYEGIKPLTKAGKMEEARAMGEEMESYITYKLNNSRKYQNYMDKVSERMGSMGQTISEKIKNMGPKEMVEFMKNKDPEDLEEDMPEA